MMYAILGLPLIYALGAFFLGGGISALFLWRRKEKRLYLIASLVVACVLAVFFDIILHPPLSERAPSIAITMGRELGMQSSAGAFSTVLSSGLAEIELKPVFIAQRLLAYFMFGLSAPILGIKYIIETKKMADENTSDI